MKTVRAEAEAAGAASVFYQSFVNLPAPVESILASKVIVRERRGWRGRHQPGDPSHVTMLAQAQF